MISLIHSGFFKDFTPWAGVLWAILFALGCLLCRVMKKRSARLLSAGIGLALTALLDLLALTAASLPLSPLWAGDGYAILGDAGLIGVSLLLPAAAGVAFMAAISLIADGIRAKRKP